MSKSPDPWSVWKHVKTGVDYTVLGRSVCATNIDPRLGGVCVVYQSHKDGKMYHREEKEFMDEGRFVRITAPDDGAMKRLSGWVVRSRVNGIDYWLNSQAYEDGTMSLLWRSESEALDGDAVAVFHTHEDVFSAWKLWESMGKSPVIEMVRDDAPPKKFTQRYVTKS